jgi:cytosine/adenosine deaminase-related metal-dependent hydrolase
MILRDVHIVGDEAKKNIIIENEMIIAVNNNTTSLANEELTIEFKNAIAFPGLINSHDHLDFNLFPKIGNGIYNNYAEWGKDIHENNKETIDAVLKVPQQLRTQWGIYKNLLNGITSVVNHGEKLDVKNDIINVFQNCYSLHSVQFEKKWKYLLNKPFIKELPFVMHVGEGTDGASHHEIDETIKWNMFEREIIGVHGVAMDQKQAGSFKALVWCPVTNYFLLGKTASINQLKNKTTVLFGTDSTLTASWNVWEHLRLARSQHLLNDAELIDSITTAAATTWKLNNGIIAENKMADIVIARKNNTASTTESFFSINPEDILLVLHKGKISLFDEELFDKVNDHLPKNYSRIFINGRWKYVESDLPLLMKEIRKYYPEVNFPISD